MPDGTTPHVEAATAEAGVAFTRLRRGLAALGWAVFGDKTGTTVFLLAVVFFGLTVPTVPFINDNYTLANALVAVADGHLHVEAFVYGPPDGPYPGMVAVDGQAYGRNYGQVFVALPFLWALSASATVVNPAWTLPLLWSAALCALAVRAGTRLDRRRAGLAAGAVAGVATFAANAALARPVDPGWHPWLALQLSTVVAAALVAVVVYRLVARTHGGRLGGFAGAAVALATPVGFWARFPKRHSPGALCVVVALYCLHRSRAAPTSAQATRFRALAYVPVGLATWVHAPEGVVLFLALGAVDALTARSNDPRELAVVAATLGLAMLPFLVTNTLVAGNPVEPPRRLPDYAEAVGTTAGPATGGADAGGGTLTTLVELLVVFVAYMARSAASLLDVGRLFDVFVRGGNELGIGQAVVGGRSLNLAVLEAMPLAAALLATPVVAYRRVRARAAPNANVSPLAALREHPARATDAFAVVYLLLLVVLYLPRLPIQVSFTVRYLHPLYPLACYLLVRLPAVRAVVEREWRLLAGSYAAVLLVGGPAFVAALGAFAGNLEAAVQYHARLALSAGAVVLYWVVAAAATDGYERGGAVALAFAAAVTTLYLVLSAVLYFTYTDRFALPVTRLVVEWLVLW
jgi:hypothetical protein